MHHHAPHCTTAEWLRQERARLRPVLMLHAFHPTAGMHARVESASPAERLRSIADDIDARVAVGCFSLCFEDDRQDMATLPAALQAIANEIGR